MYPVNTALIALTIPTEGEIFIETVLEKPILDDVAMLVDKDVLDILLELAIDVVGIAVLDIDLELLAIDEIKASCELSTSDE